MALSLNQKTYHSDFLAEVPSQLAEYPAETFGESEWIIQPKAHFEILKKMQQGVALKDLPISINYGIKTGYNDAFFIDEDTKERLIAEDPKSAELIKPLLRGRDLQAWYTSNDGQYMINPHNGLPKKSIAPIIIEEYPAIKAHLDQFITQLSKRGDKGLTPYNLRSCDYLEEFSKPKILYSEITSFFPFVFDDKGLMCNNKIFFITANDDSVNLKYITAILNSKLCKLWIWYNCPELQGGTREIRKVYFENFRIPVDGDQQFLAEKTDQQMQQVTQLQEKRTRFLRRLSENFEGIKITTTLQTFDQLDFKGFVAELKKQKIKLSLVQQDEWEEYFNQYREACQQLTARIAETDQEIDLRVYHLYGLTYDEVLTVDPNTPIKREEFEK